ncbi:MAG: phosphatidylserine decarboxylase [Candidatus Pelagibacter sp. TMED196]|nr:MAG: phosphatidylserine decarboxylase [Candidatus Pelagibacter sp. TMED196]|tara:strand:+ start:69 stop:719 length:651 start_codon:yes stop_codon:yes gene_type:complete
MFEKIFPKIHPEGYKFLAISGVITLVFWLMSNFFGFVFAIITIWVYYFFRDPDRVIIQDDNFLVSPADGVISGIKEISGPMELGLENQTFTRISVFMNVFDCHVNRSPVSGKIEDIFYKPGKFLNASLDKASDENERNYFKIKDNKTQENIIVVQIAGLIARRIVTQTEKNQELVQGERIGMIRFGSRVDLYFNKRKIMVKVGQNVIAGESLIAQI